MRNPMTPYGVPAMLLALTAAVGAGCSETEIQGVILDKDLNDPELMLAVARGSNSELLDTWTIGDGYFWTVLSGTDDFVNDGTANSEVEFAISDFSRRQAAEVWNQALEASWAGLKGIATMREVFDEETFNTSPLVARSYINSGLAERLLGDAYGEAVYGFGLNGGFQLPGDQVYDGGQVVPRDSIFQRAATFFQLGLEYAERAVAAGVETPDDDPLFDPERLVLTGHGGLAQAYMAMASLGRNPTENWQLAVQHAQQVPTDFVAYMRHHELVDNGNLAYDWTWNNDDITVWGAVIGGIVFGTPATALWDDDPRVSVTHCGDFVDPAAGINSDMVDNEVCGPNDDYRAESNDMPDWAPDKYPDEGTDVEMITGTEMRLIEAEAALERGDLPEFTIQVNAARAAHGADPILQPATIGEFEWPNAEDDARSILDRERYLDGWLEGRRAFDLSRWNHPWITEGHSLIPRHADRLAGNPRPFSALPVPLSECNINDALECPVLQ